MNLLHKITICGKGIFRSLKQDENLALFNLSSVFIIFMKTVSMDIFSIEALGSYATALAISALVSLVAITKKIGYFPALLLSFVLALLLILARIPYPLWISSCISLFAFLIWPSSERPQGNKKVHRLFEKRPKVYSK
jgi:hypothetical protein